MTAALPLLFVEAGTESTHTTNVKLYVRVPTVRSYVGTWGAQ